MTNGRRGSCGMMMGRESHGIGMNDGWVGRSVVEGRKKERWCGWNMGEV